MSLYNIFGLITVIVSLFAYVNYKFIKLPTTIGVMLISLICSIVLVSVGHYLKDIHSALNFLIEQLQFKDTLLKGILGCLLFAGAMQVDVKVLLKVKWVVLLLALIGTILSTFFVGGILYFASLMLPFQLDFIYCLLFGAIISPTDPIAVIAMLKSVAAPEKLEMKIAGESLFNDGIGIVLFSVICSLVVKGGSVQVHEAVLLFFQEAGGGVLYGFLLGGLLHAFSKGVNNEKILVLLSLAIVTGGYDFGLYIGVSAPIAMVIAGLMHSTRGKEQQKFVTKGVENVWELIDEVLNIFLFVLIGVQIIVIDSYIQLILPCLLAIPITLFSRWLSIYLPVTFFPFIARTMNSRIIKILTWGGLRGGLGLAMALSIPEICPPEVKGIIICMTYVVVVFSIVFQGLTFRYMDLKKL